MIPKTDPSSDKYLVAFFSGLKGTTGSCLAEEIRAFATKNLPGYMIPSRFIPINEMPYTPSGKIDRRLLEGMDIQIIRPQNTNPLPANETEEKLIALFSKIMNMDALAIERHDDFFKSGMDSLGAVRFINILEKTFNHRLLFSELMDNSTPHTLANLLSGRPGLPPRQMIVPIAERGTKPPFFCITAGFGDIIKLRQLSRHLGNEQPFFMVQPNDEDPAMGATPLAQQYAAQILNRCPNGPYRLGGYSAGGLMAYETARLLKEQGHEVDILVLIGAPHSYNRFASLVNKKIRSIMLRLLPDSEKKVVSNSMEILRAVFLDKGLQYHLEALVGYRPEGYKDKIHYFQGKWAISNFLGTHRTWCKNTKSPFELHMLPGNHDSFMKAPHVAKLAGRLKQCLAGLDPNRGKDK